MNELKQNQQVDGVAAGSIPAASTTDPPESRQNRPDSGGSSDECARECAYPSAEQNALIRFWKKVDKNGPIHPHRPELGRCWLWTGSCCTAGYGHFRPATGRTKVLAHRFAYALANGPIPQGKQLLHSCDERRCCNPTHASPGTALQNAYDCDSRGRRNPQPTAAVRLRALHDAQLVADEAWRLP